MENSLKKILSQFNIDTDIEDYGNGHINDTYLCDTTPRCILQRINSKVFNNPQEVMENILNVTKHLVEKIKLNGGDISRETLTVMPTVNGESFYKMDQDNYFRVYKFIENSISYDMAASNSQLTGAGKSFGKFQRMLDDFPVEKLYETILDFHNTPVRVKQLEEAVKNNLSGRKEEVLDEINFALEYAKKYANLIVDAINNEEVPLRVTHNDTKLNNVLFDKKTGEAICVIDLDTVMPGSILYDFGDALRFGASSAVEDETDLEKVYFDLSKFEAFANGFIGEVKSCLTKKEFELLPVSALILTYECGMRFLTDYINGDTYFKIHYEKQNLDRARNQFKLVRDIESKLDQMKQIINKL